MLHQFTGSPDGAEPWQWRPRMGSDGQHLRNYRWREESPNLGTVFQMTKSGNDWTETPIYSFTGPDGQGPVGGVILDSNGNLFGTTAEGGLYGYGTVFELTYNINSGWTETVLYSFQNLSDGQLPYAGLGRATAPEISTAQPVMAEVAAVEPCSSCHRRGTVGLSPCCTALQDNKGSNVARSASLSHLTVQAVCMEQRLCDGSEQSRKCF